MSLSRLFLSCLLLGSLTHGASADFLRAELPVAMGPSTEVSEPAHVLVVGVGNELGDLLQRAATTRALKYRELHPRAPIVFITFIEGTAEANSARLARVGFGSIRVVPERYVDRNVVRQIAQVPSIRSLDFFRHNSPHYGIQLESKYSRFAPDSPGLETLRKNFTPDAYAFVHGCNGGWNVARIFSQRFKIPVAGSFASTDFEYLHGDGQFYQKNTGQFPSAEWRTENGLSFETPRSCALGGCIRMKPDNAPYEGSWGSLSGGGLNIYKFFCPGLDQSGCEATMARSLLTFPSVKNISEHSTPEEFRTVVLDFLCPTQSKGIFRDACRKDLENYAETGKRLGKVFRGREVQCDFKGCQATVDCRKDAAGALVHGSCVVNNRSPSPTNTVQEEYLSYLRGFALLSR